MSFETISVIGLGYIGLPTAAMFASRKKKVIGVDINEDTVNTINRGEIHIVEPDLDMIVYAAVTEGFFKAVSIPEPADAFLIAVPTPFIEGGNTEIPEPDLQYIRSATLAIAPVLKAGDLVVLESTSPIGATEQMVEWLAEARPDLSFPNSADEKPDVNVSHCPERVLPGHVVRELVENDRVIGGITAQCSNRSVELYSTFVKGECVVTNARTAEMAKLTENSCRDVQIAFANELSMICEKLEIDVWELISLANRHPRINILQPGPGVGGHCIAVDPWFIVSKTPNESKIIHSARKVNNRKPNWAIEQIKKSVDRFSADNPTVDRNSITVACYGLTFKPDIDDLRQSPALSITEQLSESGIATVVAVEPNISEKTSASHGIPLVSMLAAEKIADIKVVLVKHKEFINAITPSEYDVDLVGLYNEF